eukprot:SAG22_NODE_1457_length_4381_cov_6.147828_4_plen_204_part_00
MADNLKMPSPRSRSASVPPPLPPTALKTVPSRSPSPAGRKLFVYAVRAPGNKSGKIFKDWPSASDALFRKHAAYGNAVKIDAEVDETIEALTERAQLWADERFLPEGPPADFRDWIKKQHIVVRVSGICWLLLALGTFVFMVLDLTGDYLSCNRFWSSAPVLCAGINKMKAMVVEHSLHIQSFFVAQMVIAIGAGISFFMDMI